MSVPDAMLEPRLRRYKLRALRFPLGTGVLRLVIPDSGAWMRGGDWLPALRSASEPPYWCEVWPAAAAVARLWSRLGGVQGQHVLDLGCGLGLPGIAAARGGASVTFFDMEQAALDFAAWNARRECVEGASISAVQGRFGAPVAGAPFDWIAMSDVTYRPSVHADLLSAVDSCLSATGAVVHADPQRDDSTRFLASLARKFAVRTAVRRTCLQQRTVEVRIAIATRVPQRADELIARVPQ